MKLPDKEVPDSLAGHPDAATLVRWVAGEMFDDAHLRYDDWYDPEHVEIRGKLERWAEHLMKAFHELQAN